jgi:hypothetical protein
MIHVILSVASTLYKRATRVNTLCIRDRLKWVACCPLGGLILSHMQPNADFYIAYFEAATTRWMGSHIQSFSPNTTSSMCLTEETRLNSPRGGAAVRSHVFNCCWVRNEWDRSSNIVRMPGASGNQAHPSEHRWRKNWCPASPVHGLSWTQSGSNIGHLLYDTIECILLANISKASEILDVYSRCDRDSYPHSKDSRDSILTIRLVLKAIRVTVMVESTFQSGKGSLELQYRNMQATLV